MWWYFLAVLTLGVFIGGIGLFCYIAGLWPHKL